MTRVGNNSRILSDSTRLMLYKVCSSMHMQKRWKPCLRLGCEGSLVADLDNDLRCTSCGRRTAEDEQQRLDSIASSASNWHRGCLRKNKSKA